MQRVLDDSAKKQLEVKIIITLTPYFVHQRCSLHCTLLYHCPVYIYVYVCLGPGLHGGVNVSSGQRGPGSESRKCVVVWRAAD